MLSISHEKFTLSNGLDVILHEDHSIPIAAVNVWYHVGSKDEEVGRTGFAHLFEHVMFEGSKHHDRSYFDPLQKVGAGLNGSTTNDRTNYWETVPSNYLELALWLESDRMGFLLDALDQKRFDIQRDVVKNERRQSYENRPYGMAPMLLQPALFPPPHPYNWMTIGVPEDLDAATLDDVKSFFRRFYHPSNASLAIAGDFDPDEARRLVERYFGDLEPGPAINRVGRMDSDLRGSVSLSMRDRVQLPRLYLAWPGPPDFDDDQPALDLLSAVLGAGKSSRLHRTLVHERQIARDVAVYHHAQEIAGELLVQITVNPGQSVEDVEAAAREEIGRVAGEPVSDSELASVMNRTELQYVRQLERLGGFGGRADVLNYFNTHTGDPAGINREVARYRGVSADDIRRVAAATLGDAFVRLKVLPERRLAPSASAVDRSVMPAAAAAPRFGPPSARSLSLSNGMRILYLPKPGLPLVSYGLLLRAGSTTDPSDRPGLADMTASMLSEGTTTRSSRQISDEMEMIGAGLGCDVGRELVVLATETLESNWERSLEIMSDVARNPTFPDEELDRVREQRLTDLRRIGDSPAAVAGRASRALFYGPDSPYGHPAAGTEESVRTMGRDALRAHHEERYGPSAATLLVVGDFSDDEVLARAEACLGDWAAGSLAPDAPAAHPAEDVETPTIYLADKPGAAQSVIRAGHLTVERSHPDYFALTLLNYAFGGHFAARLNMNLRQDKGYSYGYMSSVEWHTRVSALTSGGAVQTAVTAEAVEETLKEFSDIAGDRPVTEEEFRAARDGYLRALPAQMETHGQLLNQLVGMAVFGLPDDYLSRISDGVRGVGLDDLHRVAAERVDARRLKLLVVGDGEAIEPGLRKLGLPIVQVDYDGRLLE